MVPVVTGVDITDADMIMFRQMAESMMADRCVIRRKIGQTIDDDGAVVTEYSIVYEGKCKVQSTETLDSTPDAGGHTFSIQRARLDVPVARTADDYKPQVGDVATIETAEFDPHLAGAALRVTGLLHKTRATAYRLAVTDEVA